MKSIRCLIGFHAYEMVKDCTITKYHQCKLCGARTYTIHGNCYQPLDKQWLNGGGWYKMIPPSTPRK